VVPVKNAVLMQIQELGRVHQETSSGNGQPLSHSYSTKSLLNQRQCQKRLNWAKEKKNWTVAQWSKFLLGFALHLQIKVPEFGGRVEKHRIQLA